LQSTLGFSDASAFSAHSAVKREDIVISQIKNGAITRPFSSQNGTHASVTPGVFLSRITPNGWGSRKAICDATSCQQTEKFDSALRAELFSIWRPKWSTKERIIGDIEELAKRRVDGYLRRG
jgi:hypothetical protein